MTKKPWMKFYPQDWRSDEKLRLCSIGARGLWVEVLCLMHRSERYGQLLIGGRVPTDAQLAVQVGMLPDQVPPLMAELEEAGVFSRTSGGAIYSRRMTRDHKLSENSRKNGQKGGNPALGVSHGKQMEKSCWDKGGVKPPDKVGVKPKKPEARNQNNPPTPQTKTGDPPMADGGGYRFCGKVIRLRQDDYDKWRKLYSALPDFDAELQARDDWLASEPITTQKRWFVVVSSVLNKRHQAMTANPPDTKKTQATGDYLDFVMERDKRRAAHFAQGVTA